MINNLKEQLDAKLKDFKIEEKAALDAIKQLEVKKKLKIYNKKKYIIIKIKYIIIKIKYIIIK